jgi:flavin-dependent dehydrogenase
MLSGRGGDDLPRDSGMYDVAIIGGGPGGSTTAGLLKKYRPELSVLVLEKERFPREHVGESQLPPISAVLHELGAWEKVEAAGFPLKIGATYTWGRTVDPWVFQFLPLRDVPVEVERPGEYEGWRKQTAFQVDRARYDEILLDHAAALGAEVRQGVRVRSVERTADRVAGLVLDDGSRIEARHYVDASGNAAILRRALDVKVEVPTPLKNVAFWDYWENPDWALDPERMTSRVHVRSLPYGWLWYIPISATRTSIGLVCNAEYYKNAGKPYEELYRESLAAEAFVSKAIAGATSRGQVEATNDWSYVVDRAHGENWFLVGESAGFADPILAAGLTLTQVGARELACTILELERNELDPRWLKRKYDELQRRRVRQHMRFAEFWYSANGMFEAVRENCVKIAEESGFSLTPGSAFQWLATGGLADDAPGQAGIGGLDLAGVKQVVQMFTGGKAQWKIDGKNVFRLNLSGAVEEWDVRYEGGRVERIRCWMRGNRRLGKVGVQGVLLEVLEHHIDIEKIMDALRAAFARTLSPAHVEVAITHAIQVLEVLVDNFWVKCETRKHRPTLEVRTPEEGTIIHLEGRDPLDGRGNPALGSG